MCAYWICPSAYQIHTHSGIKSIPTQNTQAKAKQTRDDDNEEKDSNKNKITVDVSERRAPARYSQTLKTAWTFFHSVLSVFVLELNLFYVYIILRFISKRFFFFFCVTICALCSRSADELQNHFSFFSFFSPVLL